MNKNIGRRGLIKYLLALGAFGLTSLLGFKKEEGFVIGKRKNLRIGTSEASAECGASYSCTGGGGECGASYSCTGGGNDSSGGGECGSSYSCAGGGGECGASYSCAGD